MRKITALLAVALLVGCREQPAATSHGRYQIVKGVAGSTANGSVLLDTDTGRVWGLVKYSPVESAILLPIPIVDDPTLFKVSGDTFADFNEKMANALKEHGRQQKEELQQKQEPVAEDKNKQAKKEAEDESDWVDVK